MKYIIATILLYILFKNVKQYLLKTNDIQRTPKKNDNTKSIKFREEDIQDVDYKDIDNSSSE